MKDLNLIRKCAWEVHNMTGFPFEDLFAEASLKYCEMRWLEGDKPGKFSVFVYKGMRNALITYVNKNRCIKANTVLFEDLVTEAQNLDEVLDVGSSTGEYSLELLPQELKEVLEIILEGEDDMGRVTPRQARAMLRKELKKRGWSNQLIWDAIRFCKANVSDICQKVFTKPETLYYCVL